MCGRYASRTPLRETAKLFRVRARPPDFQPSWNIAPGQDAPIIRRHPETGERHLDLLRWGLLPHWTKDAATARRPINARAETVVTSAFFRDAFAARRAIVPADAFYEWQRAENVARAGAHARKAGKQPFAAARADATILAMAAIWEGWRGPDASVVRSFAIVTTSANAEMAPIHDRMPVILKPSDWDTWLDGPADAAASLLHPAPDGTLRLWPVSSRVNAPAANDRELLSPVS